MFIFSIPKKDNPKAPTMPGKAMKCIVDVDLYVVTCPGTFLRDLDYVYLHMEVLGLEARTKSVPPTFPLFFHQRLKFEKTFSHCTDPGQVANFLKTQDVILELRQHRDYATDFDVIAHCSSNTHDFLYPAISAYYGPGREILLYKTSNFKPIRVTGEPVKLEYSTKTVIKEVAVYSSTTTSPSYKPRSSYVVEKAEEKVEDKPEEAKIVEVKDDVPVAEAEKTPPPPEATTPPAAADETNVDDEPIVKEDLEAEPTSSPEAKKPESPRGDATAADDFVIRRKDDNLLANRDFSTYVRPTPRRSKSPLRASPRRSKSPTRSLSRAKSTNALDATTVEPLPATPFVSSLYSSKGRHSRSASAPLYRSSVDRLRETLEDLDLEARRRHHRRMYRSLTSPHVVKALNSSKRIAERVDDLILRGVPESDMGLDVLRESLRDERNALNDAIKAADREAFYRTLNRTR